MNIPVVKEHGSWVVFIFSCAAGITTGLLYGPIHAGSNNSIAIVSIVAGLALLINSKSALSSVLRTKSEKNTDLLWFAVFSLSGGFFLIPLHLDGLKVFVPFLPLVILYVILLSLKREHNLFTELLGFSILTISAPIVYFAVTGEMSYRIYFSVLIFFAAGVFKVRMKIRKDMSHRIIMVFYCVTALVFFSLLDISLFLLVPFLENIMSAVWMREEKFRTTGNIELLKGLVFTILLIFFWF